MQTTTKRSASLEDLMVSCSLSRELVRACSQRIARSGCLVLERLWPGIRLEKDRQAFGPASGWLTTCWTTSVGAALTYLRSRELRSLRQMFPFLCRSFPE